ETKGGGGDHNAKEAAHKVKPGEVEVAVLEGTSGSGLPAAWGAQVEEKGFGLGAGGESGSEFGNSVVRFVEGAKTEARGGARRKRITKVQPMTAEVAGVSNQAKVSIVVGEDNAAAEG